MAGKLTKAGRAARQREQQRAIQAAREQASRRHGRMKLLQFGGVGLALAIVLALFVYYSRQQSPGGSGTAVAAAVGPVTAATPSSPTGNFHQVSAPLRQGSKSVLLFIGAQYCPFCGAERWAIVKALGRLGTWSKLSQGNSSSGQDGFDTIPTFDLLHAGYDSSYVAFDHKDVADNAGNNLESLSSQEQSLFNRLDPSGSIPLVYVDGYAMTGSGYSPAELQGKSFSGVQGQLEQNGSEAYVSDINAEANLLTGFLCKATGNRPAGVCRTAIVQRIERGIR
jgi:hypothetical protein